MAMVPCSKPLACVIGDLDLVRPLGLAGIRCAVVARLHDPVRYTRFAAAVLNRGDPAQGPEEFVEQLVRFGHSQRQPPVLFYQADRDLLLVSRYRERLALAFCFVVPDQTLVEDLVDKGRFLDLAAQLDLPVPRARRLTPEQAAAVEDLDLAFPVIIKPLTWEKGHTAIAAAWSESLADARSGKARRIDTIEQLRLAWRRLAAAGVGVLVQELVPGPEARIESYHVYVDEAGQIVGEFTGQKIRTFPLEFGESTAVMITNHPDVAALGRDLTRRLKLRGVAKFDFKRGPDGRLYLLEINPRFNLWHHPAALAGVNLPALVYGDLTGLPRPAVSPARPGVRWAALGEDARAAQELGVPRFEWLRWALRCEAKGALVWDDPMPYLRGILWRRLSRLRSGLRPGHLAAGTAAQGADAH